LPATGSEGELLARDTVVAKDPIASNPASTENVAEADPPAGMAEKSHCTFRPVVWTQPLPLAQKSPAA
jgi:hypothetical protein